jgi:broad specificity phosphatase PhoE
MSLLYLIRHGHASTTWEPGDWDPGLSELGRGQAEARAEQLAGLRLHEGTLPLLSSPLRRARETAAALERRWQTAVAIEPRVGEIQAFEVAPELRREWLKSILQRRWSELGSPDSPLDRWRIDVLQAILGITQDTIVFTHSVAINVAVGFALGDDRVTCFRPANCSCTVVEAGRGTLRIVELGSEDTAGIV